MKEKKDRKLVITPLDSSKKVSQVLANDTCRSILDAVSEEAMSASQISKKLDIPLTTVDYNLKKLQEVDLIGVHHKRWSPKGKKVNYYAPEEKFIVIAPSMRRAQVISALKGMLPLIALVVVAAGFAGWLTLQQMGTMHEMAFLGEGNVSEMEEMPAGALHSDVQTCTGDCRGDEESTLGKSAGLPAAAGAEDEEPYTLFYLDKDSYEVGETVTANFITSLDNQYAYGTGEQNVIWNTENWFLYRKKDRGEWERVYYDSGLYSCGCENGNLICPILSVFASEFTNFNQAQFTWDQTEYKKIENACNGQIYDEWEHQQVSTGNYKLSLCYTTNTEQTIKSGIPLENCVEKEFSIIESSEEGPPYTE